MPRYTLKQGDSLPTLQETLLDEVGDPIDLTSATVEFHMKRVLATLPTVQASATIIDGAGGQVEYEWGLNDMATPGTFDCEWMVTFGDERVQRSPSFQIEIEAGVA